MNGKGDKPRKVNRKKWDDCPLWKNLKKQEELKIERIVENDLWNINVNNAKDKSL